MDAARTNSIPFWKTTGAIWKPEITSQEVLAAGSPVSRRKLIGKELFLVESPKANSPYSETTDDLCIVRGRDRWEASG